MAIEMNQPQKVYTVKCLAPEGGQLFIDLPATGQGDAEAQFKAKYPNHRVLNIYRKS